MIYLGANYDKITGPDATCSYKIVMSVDESQRSGLKELMDLKKGTQILLTISTINGDGNDEMVTETEEQAKQRLFRKMHAIINEIATNKGMNPEDIKNRLKEFLVSKNFIQTSSKELDIKGLSAAIFYLKNDFN